MRIFPFVMALALALQTDVVFGQTDSLVDVFPLTIGNQWSYNYYSYLHEPPMDLITTDSGSARLTVYAKQSSGDSTIWGIRQERDIVRTTLDLGGGHQGTRDAVRDTTRITLVELHSGQHKLYTNSTAFNVWSSVFPFGADLNDTTEVFRYRKVDSLGVAKFITFRTPVPPEQCPYVRFTFEFRRNLGAFTVSCRETCFTSFFRTNHMLVSSTIVKVSEQDDEFWTLRPSLAQNFPNPFNPTTTIKYQIPSAGHVMLKVFDLLGREVATLVDGIQDAGFKEVQFDANDLSSGVYFYRLEYPGHYQSKKMILIR